MILSNGWEVPLSVGASTGISRLKLAANPAVVSKIFADPKRRHELGRLLPLEASDPSLSFLESRFGAYRTISITAGLVHDSNGNGVIGSKPSGLLAIEPIGGSLLNLAASTRGGAALLGLEHANLSLPASPPPGSAAFDGDELRSVALKALECVCLCALSHLALRARRSLLNNTCIPENLAPVLSRSHKVRRAPARPAARRGSMPAINSASAA